MVKICELYINKFVRNKRTKNRLTEFNARPHMLSVRPHMMSGEDQLLSCPPTSMCTQISTHTHTHKHTQNVSKLHRVFCRDCTTEITEAMWHRHALSVTQCCPRGGGWPSVKEGRHAGHAGQLFVAVSHTRGNRLQGWKVSSSHRNRGLLRATWFRCVACSEL